MQRTAALLCSFALAAGAPPSPGRYGFSFVATPSGAILLMGGEVDRPGPNLPLNDVWRSTDSASSWVQLTNAAWTARSEFGAVTLDNNEILVMGGSDASGDRRDVWVSNDNGGLWTPLADAPWSARQGHAVVPISASGGGVTPNRIALIAGSTSDSAYSLDDVWLSSDRGRSWTSVGSTLPSGYSGSLKASSDGSNIYLMSFTGVIRSSDAGATWTSVSAPFSGLDGRFTSPRFMSEYNAFGGVSFVGRAPQTFFSWESWDSSWHARTLSIKPTASLPLAAVKTGDHRIVMMAGRWISERDSVFEAWRSNDDGISWKLVCEPGEFAGEYCEPCRAGSYCPAGATAPVPCPTGTFCPAGSRASSPCPFGFYCPPGAASAQECPSGSMPSNPPISCVPVTVVPDPPSTVPATAIGIVALIVAIGGIAAIALRLRNMASSAPAGSSRQVQISGSSRPSLP